MINDQWNACKDDMSKCFLSSQVLAICTKLIVFVSSEEMFLILTILPSLTRLVQVQAADCEVYDNNIFCQDGATKQVLYTTLGYKLGIVHNIRLQVGIVHNIRLQIRYCTQCQATNQVLCTILGYKWVLYTTLGYKVGIVHNIMLQSRHCTQHQATKKLLYTILGYKVGIAHNIRLQSR